MPDLNRPAVDDDSLAELLAEAETAAAEQGATIDHTLDSVRADLETLTDTLKLPPPPDPFADEPDCRNTLEKICDLGREPATQELAAAADAPEPSAEIVVLGQYQLLEKLGAGGMGTVYKALHRRLDKIVALKVLPTDRLEDQGAVARFNREMRAVGKLEHPNIVRAMDAGDVEGTHYLVMELVDGEDVGSLIRRRGPLPVAASCEIIRQAALGLQHAHEHGLVHRDIKPSNLIVTRVKRQESRDKSGVESASLWTLDSGLSTVKILDMGLALLEDAHIDAAELTSTGQIMGTLDYMAPEQGADTHSVDIRADVYSLGATLYKLLTGRAPFDTPELRSPVKKLMALATADPTPIGQLRPDVPEDLAALVHRMLAKSPDARPTPPGIVANELAKFCAGADLAALFDPIEDEREVGTLQLRRGMASPQEAPTSPDARSESLQETFISPTGVDELPSIDTTRALPNAAVGGRAGNGRRWLLLAGGLMAAALLAVVIVILTDRGTVVIEADPALTDELQITVLSDGEVAKDEWRLQPGVNETRIRSGNVQVALPAGQEDQFLVQEAGSAELRRGGKVVFKLTRIPAASVRSGELTATAPNPDRVAAQWTLSIGGAVSVDGGDAVIEDVRDLPTESFRLTAVNLEGSRTADRVTDAGLTNLADCRNLQFLNLYDAKHVTDESAHVFQGLKELRHLNLGGTQVSHVGLSKLGNAPRLEFLGVGRHCGDEVFAICRNVKNLKSLGLSHTQVSDAGLAQLPQLQSLTGIHLDNLRNVAGFGLVHLQQLERLEAISLDGTPLGNEALLHLRACRNLHGLTVSGRGITDEGMIAFDGWTKLHSLKLSQTSVTDAGLRHLRGCTGLHLLVLPLNKLTVASIETFQALPSLATLNLRGTPFTAEEIQRFAAALPRCRIEWDGGVLEPTASESVEEPKFALQFDGVDDWIEIPGLEWSVDEPWTFEARITPSPQKPSGEAEPGQQFDPIFLHSGLRRQPFTLIFDRPNQSWWMAHQKSDEDRLRQLYFRGDAEPREHALAIVWDGKELRLFLDGKLKARGGAISRLPPPDAAGAPEFVSTLGRIYDLERKTLQHFCGRLGEIRVSSVARYTQDYVPSQQLESDEHTLAHYPMDEGEGAVLKDASGHGHHGKIVGAEWVSLSDDDNFALHLAPRTWQPLPLNSDLRTTDTFTLEFWLRPHVDGFSPDTLIAALGSTSIGCPYDNKCRAGLGSLEKNFYETPGVALEGGGWIHLAAVSEGGRKVHFFADGKSIGSREIEGKPVDLLLERIELGNSALDLEADFDEVRLSRGALYVKDFVPQRRLNADDATVALYHFDEGAGIALRDSSRNENHGEFQGAEWVRLSDERGAAGDAPQPEQRLAAPALQFDGDGDLVEIPPLQLSGRAITIEAWATLGTDDLGEHGIPLWQWGDTAVGVKADQSPVIDIASTHKGFEGVTFMQPRDKIVRDRRTHFAAILTDDRCELFINGHRAGSKASADVMGDVDAVWTRLLSSGFTVGSRKLSLEGRRSYWTGTLSAFRISDTVRYTDSFTPPDSFQVDDETLALYRLREAAGEVLSDSSGNEHHGKITGAQWIEALKP